MENENKPKLSLPRRIILNTSLYTMVICTLILLVGAPLFMIFFGSYCLATRWTNVVSVACALPHNITDIILVTQRLANKMTKYCSITTNSSLMNYTLTSCLNNTLVYDILNTTCNEIYTDDNKIFAGTILTIFGISISILACVMFVMFWTDVKNNPKPMKWCI